MKQDAITPRHYKAGKVECIDALESATTHKQGIEAVCVANIIKYLWRYEAKGGVQDVKKAKWYLERLICHLETKEKSKDSSGGVKKLNKQQAAGFLMRKRGCADFCAEIRLERLSHKQKASSLLYRKKPTPKTRKEVLK